MCVVLHRTLVGPALDILYDENGRWPAAFVSNNPKGPRRMSAALRLPKCKDMCQRTLFYKKWGGISHFHPS